MILTAVCQIISYLTSSEFRNTAVLWAMQWEEAIFVRLDEFADCSHQGAAR